MVEVNSLEAEGFDGEFYKIQFQRMGFLLFPPPDLSILSHFSRTRQHTLGKMNIHFNLTSLLKYPHFFKDIHYVLLTNFQEILYMPFFCRMFPQTVIIATSLAYQLARIFLETFHEILSDFNATSQEVNFFKQSQILDRYQQDMEVNFDEWRKLYSREEITNMLTRIVKVNYHQIYNTQRGMFLRSFPSGKNNGSCFWELHSSLTNEKILLVNELSQYNWRTCQPYSLQRLKESQESSPYRLVIFTKKALYAHTQGQDTRIADTINRVNMNANLGISTTVVLGDDTLCIDLIPHLAVQPEGKIQGILLSNQSLHSIHNYVNSYTDYLSQYYRDQLFSDTPDYPLIHYSKLKEKGFISIGTLEELAVKRKLPLKEIVLQSHPFVHFVKNYQHYLQIEDLSQISTNVKYSMETISLASNFNGSLLKQFLTTVDQARVVTFGQTLAKIECLQIGRKYNLTGDKITPLYLTASNSSNRIFQHFILINNQLQLKRKKQQFLKIPKNWIELLSNELSVRGIAIQEKDRKGLKTGSTSIYLSSEWQLCVSSKSVQELLAVSKSLENVGKKYQLQ